MRLHAPKHQPGFLSLCRAWNTEHEALSHTLRSRLAEEHAEVAALEMLCGAVVDRFVATKEVGGAASLLSCLSGAASEQHAMGACISNAFTVALDQYTWALSADTTRDNIMAPDIFGWLAVPNNRGKPAGAYYTAPDIAQYIARFTVLPALLDAAKRIEPSAFAPSAAHWNLLWAHPARYLPGSQDISSDGMSVEPRAPRLFAGHSLEINDLITLQVDIGGLLRDSVLEASDTALANALLTVAATFTVVDPTCGSGEFLLAALNELGPILSACRVRLGDISTARETTEAIVRNNLYGIDIMPEAVFLTRLRLALRVLAACGSAGGLTLGERKMASAFLSGLSLDKTIQRGDALDGAISELEMKSRAWPTNAFHWPERMPHVAAEGHRANAVIGNPPYVSLTLAPSDASRFRCAKTGNAYALVMERALALAGDTGRCGMILPIASTSTQSMAPLRGLYADRGQWHAHFATRPGKLFAGVDMNLVISLLASAQPDGASLFTSRYMRWSDRTPWERLTLLQRISFVPWRQSADDSAIPKVGTTIELDILRAMKAGGQTIADYTREGGALIFYHSGGRYWRKAMLQKLSSHYKPLAVALEVRDIVLCLLNSQLFYWYWILHSNCMDVVRRDVMRLPVFDLGGVQRAPFVDAAAHLLACYARHQQARARRGARIVSNEMNVDVSRAKPIIDEIDRMLAAHYGLGPDALRFIVDYDIRYRMPRAPGDEVRPKGSVLTSA